MKIKIIDLLVKIANGEEVPQIIKYQSELWEYNEYYDDYEKDTIYLFGYLFAHENTDEFINDKVEIIEPKNLNGKTTEYYKDKIIIKTY